VRLNKRWLRSRYLKPRKLQLESQGSLEERVQLPMDRQLLEQACGATGAMQNQTPIGPAKGNLKWGPGVEAALREFKAGHTDGISVLLVRHTAI
jgi:hypothetical protein